MITANATTSESGYRLYGAHTLGRPISNRDLYATKAGRETNFVYQAEATLGYLRDRGKGYLSIVALHLINEKRHCATLSATVYADKRSGLHAVRVPSMGTVTITTKYAMYPTKSDDSFRIGKPRGQNESY